MMGSFTRVTKENNYVRPSLNDEHILDIKNGRHPVIERYIDNYIPNDIKDVKRYINIINHRSKYEW